MPNQNDGEFVPVGVQVDQGSFADLDRRLDVMGQKIEILRRTNQAWANQIGQDADSVRTAFTKAGDAVSEFSRRMDIAHRAAQSQAAGNYNSLRDELGLGDTAGGSGAQQAGSGGLRIEGLRRTGGALSQLGLGAIGEPISRAGDIAQVTKELSQAGNAFKNIGPAIQATTIAIAGMEVGLAPLLTALAPIAIVAGAAAVGIKLIGDAAQRAADEAKKDYDAQVKLLDEKEKVRQAIATQTAAQTQANITDIEQQRQDQIKLLNDLKAAREKTATDYTALGSSLNPAERARLGALGTQQDQNIKDATARLAELDHQWVLLTQDIKPAIDKREDETAAINAQIKTINDAAAVRTRYLADDKLTTKQITERVQALRDENVTIQGQIKALEPLKDKSDAAKKEYEQLTEQLKTNTAEAQHLTDASYQLARATEARAEAEKKSEKAVKEAADYITKQNADIVSAYKTHNQNVATIEENDLQARADIQQKYNDALVRAAEDAVQAATNALDKLEQQRADLTTGLKDDLAREERDAKDRVLEIAVKAQRQERDDLTAHLRKLQEIRDRNQEQEQLAIWDRNALALLKLRLSKSQEMDAENKAFQQKKADEATQAADTQADQRRALEIQRRERLIAYDLANRDANAQYRRELQQAAAAKTKALELAAQAEQKEIAQENQKVAKLIAAEENRAKAEVKLASMTADARMKLLQAERDAALKWAAQVNGASGGSTAAKAAERGGASGSGVHGPIRTMAAGGGAQPGQIYQVNDDAQSSTESFNGVSFPPGLGLFMPRQGGTIRPGSGSNVTIDARVTINDATDPLKVGAIVGPLVEGKITHAIEKLTGDG